MTKAISTKLVDLNLGYIREHMTDKALWTKEWEVFKAGGFTAKMSLYLIDVDNGYIHLKINVSQDGKSDYPFGNNDYVAAPFDNPEYTDEAFARKVAGTIVKAIEDFGESRLRRTPAYQRLADIDDKMMDEAKKQAKEYCEEHDISDKYIVDSVIKAYQDKVDERATRYIARCMCLVYPIECAMCYRWFGRDKEAEEYLKRYCPAPSDDPLNRPKSWKRSEWMKALNMEKRLERIGIEEFMEEQE